MGVEPLEPGEVWVLALTLRAPADPGTYTAAWQVRDEEELALGEELVVEIQVPFPTPTPSVAPAVELTPTTAPP